MSQSVTFQGNPVAVDGYFPEVGHAVQNFVLVAKDLTEVDLNSYAGFKRKILNIFPSIDTRVCAASVRKFNQLVSQLKDTVVLCISADLPFAQSRFCGAEGLNHVVTLSTFRSATFGKNYGVALNDGPLQGLTTRAIIVLDDRNKVIYRQRVAEITQEPDYNAVLPALL